RSQRLTNDFNRRAILHKWQVQSLCLMHQHAVVSRKREGLPTGCWRASFSARHAAFSQSQGPARSSNRGWRRASVRRSGYVDGTGVVRRGVHAVHQRTTNDLSGCGDLFMERQCGAAALREVEVAVGMHTARKIEVGPGMVAQV